MKIRFFGAAGTVTGSRTLVQSGDEAVLVDCGMFQGYKQLRQRNWQPLDVSHEHLDAVLLTHAHLDHSGWLPALVRSGRRPLRSPGAGLLDRVPPDANPPGMG